MSRFPEGVEVLEAYFFVCFETLLRVRRFTVVMWLAVRSGESVVSRGP